MNLAPHKNNDLKEFHALFQGKEEREIEKG